MGKLDLNPGDRVSYAVGPWDRYQGKQPSDVITGEVQEVGAEIVSIEWDAVGSEEMDREWAEWAADKGYMTKAVGGQSQRFAEGVVEEGCHPTA